MEPEETMKKFQKESNPDPTKTNSYNGYGFGSSSLQATTKNSKRQSLDSKSFQEGGGDV